MTFDPQHPRPQLQRAWTTLDGTWDFALDPECVWRLPREVSWQDSILVPFAPETRRSGIEQTGYFQACWYRRRVELPVLADDERLFLNFGAVDYQATIWIDDRKVGTHEGGYTPFSFDITDFVAHSRECTIVVRAEDDPHDLAKPRGKQDWQLLPHSIWYPRTTGIWQTVWWELRPATWIESVRWTSSLADWDVACEVILGGLQRDDLRLEVVIGIPGEGAPRILAHDTYAVIAGEVHRRIMLSDPGIDDYRNEILWSPEKPTLMDVSLRLFDRDGIVVDEVISYTALRSVGVEGDRFILNGRPLRLRLVLDQGYWPDSGITAPHPEALRRDVLLAKAMGFNGVRKHQKVEDPRYLYWADRLGLLVWEEMPSAYRFTSRSIDRVVREWGEVVRRDASHPCIVTWVPFNESWGVPDLPSFPAQRDYVRAVYHLTKALDSSRPVIGNDGWESAATDIIGIHDYDDSPARIAGRYRVQHDVIAMLRQVRPAGRAITLPGHEHAGQPVVLSEFGGITYTPENRRDETWGYSRADSPAELEADYTSLLEAVRQLELLAGFCYTQFADTYQEANGLLFADRTPKFPLDRIAAATRGVANGHQCDLGEEYELLMDETSTARELAD
ncbi:MAG: glycoside hydrolase family 2 TIM barrel-domain containing protein [Thermomicrobiales bacterium]